MAVCAGCKKQVKAADKIICSKPCSLNYHYQCVGLTPNLSKIPTGWKCPTCVSKQPRGDNTDTPIRTRPYDSSPERTDDVCFTLRKQGSQSDPKLKACYGDVQREDLLILIRQELSTVLKEIISAELKPLINDIQDLKTSLSYLTNENSKLLEQIKSLESEKDNLTKRTDELELRVAKMQHENADRQQRERFLNLEIVGVPERKSENLSDLLKKIAEHAGVTVTGADIEHASRVQPRQPIVGRPRAIVVKLKSQLIKDSIISGLRKSRGVTTQDVGIAGSERRFYVNEHLTIHNKDLLKKTKERAKSNFFTYVWVKNCRIFVRKSDAAPPLLIKSMEDLKKMH